MSIRSIEGCERLEQYPFYPAALGDLELKAGRAHLAAEHFKVALLLARNPTERSFFRQRLRALSGEEPVRPVGRRENPRR